MDTTISGTPDDLGEGVAHPSILFLHHPLGKLAQFMEVRHSNPIMHHLLLYFVDSAESQGCVHSHLRIRIFFEQVIQLCHQFLNQCDYCFDLPIVVLDFPGAELLPRFSRRRLSGAGIPLFNIRYGDLRLVVTTENAHGLQTKPRIRTEHRLQTDSQ